MILKDESETGSNDLLAHRREGDVSLSFLISQEHRSCFFRSEGKDLLNHYPAFDGGVKRGCYLVNLGARLSFLFLTAT